MPHNAMSFAGTLGPMSVLPPVGLGAGTVAGAGGMGVGPGGQLGGLPASFVANHHHQQQQQQQGQQGHGQQFHGMQGGGGGWQDMELPLRAPGFGSPSDATLFNTGFQR